MVFLTAQEKNAKENARNTDVKTVPASVTLQYVMDVWSAQMAVMN